VPTPYLLLLLLLLCLLWIQVELTSQHSIKSSGNLHSKQFAGSAHQNSSSSSSSISQHSHVDTPSVSGPMVMLQLQH
jgi:hypothetical protein